MTLDFTVPRGLPQIIENSLLKLIADYQQGYLTDKGYVKKRDELLSSLNNDGTSSLRMSLRSDSISDGNRRESVMSMGSSFAPPPSEDRMTSGEFYYHSPPTVGGLVTDSPISQAVAEMPASYEYYQEPSPNVCSKKKPVQLPLDPRMLEQDIQANSVDNMSTILRERANVYAKENVVTVMDWRGKEAQTLTWEKLYLRAEKVAKQIKNKAALYPGDRVCLIYQNIEVIDFIVAFYGCFLSGTVAVPMNSSLPIKDLVYIMTDTQSHLCLMSDSVYKHFDKVNHKKKVPIWPKGVEVWKTSDMGTYEPSKHEGPPPLKDTDLAYIEYSKGSTGELRGVAISHRTVLHQMASLANILSSSPDIKKGTLVRSFVCFSIIRHLIMSTLDIRQSIGLIMGVLFSVYSGNSVIWTHQKTTEVPGLYAHIISKYRASILLSDYLSLKQVAYNYQSFPQLTRTFNKKVKVDLSSVRWCLINTMSVDCEFNDKLSDRWFKPLGHPHPRKIIAPMLCLSEHGGAIVAMRDWIGHEDKLGCKLHEPITDEVIANDEYEDGNMGERLSEVLIDKDSLTTNTVKVVSDRPPPTSSTYDDESSKYIRVGAFGYPVPDASLAIVNPEAKVLSSADEVGEIWIDSSCISGGYWGIPEATQTIFQAECADYERVLPLNFVRTGLLGFIYNGKVYVLGLYEDRISQDVTWYDKMLEQRKVKEKTSADSHSSDDNLVGSNNESRSGNNCESLQINLSYPQHRYHYASHLVRTLVRNIPEVTDCSFFNVRINTEYLPIAIIETTSLLSKKDRPSSNSQLMKGDVALLNDMAAQTFKLMEQIHNVRLFCVLVTAPNTLPRTIRSGRLEIANMLCKRKFLEGRLSSSFVRFQVSDSLTSIFHGKDLEGGIWSPYSSEIRTNVLKQTPLQISDVNSPKPSDDEASNSKSEGKTLVDMMKRRATKQPDDLAFAVIDNNSYKEMKPLSWKKFENRVFAVCNYIMEKKDIMAGDHVLLIYNLSEDYEVCLYACWLAGLIVVPVPAFSLPWANEDALSFVQIVQEYKIKAVFVSSDVEQLMRSKPIRSKIKQIANSNRIIIPKCRNTSKHTKCSITSKMMYARTEQFRKARRAGTNTNSECLIWITWNADNQYQGTALTFANLHALASTIKETCHLNSSKSLLACVRHTSGLGFFQSSVLNTYLGCTTYLFTTLDYGLNPTAFWQSIARYKIESTFVTGKMLAYALHSVDPGKCNLSNLKNLMIGWEGRPDAKLLRKFTLAFEASNLPKTAVSSVYQHPLNGLITTRSYLPFEPQTLWLDPTALSQGYVSPVNPTDYHEAVEVQESGIPSINTRIAIVNPETKKECRVGEFGEIWVSSQSTLAGFCNSTGQNSNNSLIRDKIVDDNENIWYLRTGDFGFLHSVHRETGETDKPLDQKVLFNLGKVSETFEVLGLQYFSGDLEATIERYQVVSKACVFKAGSYIVAILETTMTKNYSSLVPLVIMKIMKRFNLVLDVLSFVGQGKMPVSRLGQVQRRITLKRWMEGRLPLVASYGVNFGETAIKKSLKMRESVEQS